MANNTILMSNGERLNIRDPSIIQKAETFLRVLNSKSISKTVSDLAKIIICLDLAATMSGVNFDKETAMKLTGLRKSAYQNNLNNIEKMLGLDKPVTVSELCVQFSCTEAKELAERILHSYKDWDIKIKDIKHPQYVAAAVYTSCQLNGIKINKSQIKLVSRLKTEQWNELLEEFNKFASYLGLANKQKKRKTKKDEVLMVLEDSCDFKSNVKDKEEVIEEYEVWKERILREASAEILSNELSDQSL